MTALDAALFRTRTKEFIRVIRPEDAEVTGRLYRQFHPRIATERMTTVYETLERALVPVLSDMERAGIDIITDGEIVFDS